MAKKADNPKGSNLSSVLRRLNPNIPAGLRDDALPRIPRDSNALRQIRAHLGADPFAKLLLTGHIGVGKSTELLHLAREMCSQRWVLQCSLAKTLGIHNVNTFSLLIALLHASIHSWVTQLGEVPRGLVEELVDPVRNLLPQNKRPPKLSVHTVGQDLIAPQMTALTGEATPRLVKTGRHLLSLYEEVLQRLALRSVSSDQAKVLDPSPIASTCDLVLKELGNAAGKPVLLIIDDLDKVRSDEARDDIFLNRAMAWLRLPCGIVSTLPLDALFSGIGRELDQVWLDVQVLDPLPVPYERDGAVTFGLLSPYSQILRSVDADKIFSVQQRFQLAVASSGLPRMFVSACAASVRYALDAAKSRVEDYHVDLVLGDITDRWRGRLIDADYQALVDVLDSEGSNVPGAIQLLREGILIRDGSAPPAQQFRLANWAEPLVDAYRQRRLGKRSTPP